MILRLVSGLRKQNAPMTPFSGGTGARYHPGFAAPYGAALASPPVRRGYCNITGSARVGLLGRIAPVHATGSGSSIPEACAPAFTWSGSLVAPPESGVGSLIACVGIWLDHSLLVLALVWIKQTQRQHSIVWNCRWVFCTHGVAPVLRAWHRSDLTCGPVACGRTGTLGALLTGALMPLAALALSYPYPR
jgi:hypothetical protein